MKSVDVNKLSDGIEAPLWMFWKRRRYVVVLMAFLGFLNAYTMRVNLSVAIVAMTANRTILHENGTVSYEKHFDWSSSVQGHVLSSFFYGYILTQIPGGYISNRFGANNVFGVGVGTTAILTLLTPTAAYAGIGWLFAVRVLEGMFQGVSFPCMHVLWSRWAPPSERSRMVMFSFAGVFAGTIIAMPMSGVLAETLSWESIFYVFGTVGCVWYIGWWLIVKRSPEEDTLISFKEKEFILQSLGRVEGEQENIRHPWRAIFTSKAVFALIVANFCENWGFYTLLTQLPTFLKDTMHFEVQTTGFIAALPYFAMGLTLAVAGYLADWFQNKGILTTTQVRRYFNCSAFVMQTVFMVVGAIILEPVATVACIVVAVSMGAFAWCGYAVNHLDLSPKSAGVLMGISNSFATIAGVLSPIVTGYVTANKTDDEWRMVFYIAAGCYMVGFFVYWIWASGELQSWSIEMQERSKQGDNAKDGQFVYDNALRCED
ncbi:vesicular glutamate transporter 2-like [Toxorhynchites rutilus septentrionalis]|uniref:vesicular glutamate transporter 2-like n=1 Tax=Toxorhynchites rutilus septentrionalis TaxID=329112 RepID=UPI00247B16AB|nr:vesicular glutamate transporter 2-like [Toxorhynchites rutilus septentrionalis]